MKRSIVHLVRRESFSAAHRLWSDSLSAEENLALYGPCAREHGHGHNFDIEVTLRGPIDPATGIVINLAEMRDAIQQDIIDPIDQRHLNYECSLTQGINPSVENLVVLFWQILQQRFGDLLYEIKLRETEKNWVIYRGELSD